MAAKEQHPRLNSGLHTHAQACVPACMYVCAHVCLLCVCLHTYKDKEEEKWREEGEKNKTLNRHFTEGKKNFKFKLQ